MCIFMYISYRIYIYHYISYIRHIIINLILHDSSRNSSTTSEAHTSGGEGWNDWMTDMFWCSESPKWLYRRVHKVGSCTFFFFHFLHLSVISVMEIWIYLDRHLNGSNGVEKHKTFVESLYINMIVNSELDSTLSLVDRARPCELFGNPPQMSNLLVMTWVATTGLLTRSVST